MLLDWQMRETHEKDINDVLDRLKFRDEQGRIRMFIGALFYPEAKKTGHTSMGFDQCACRTPVGAVAIAADWKLRGF